MNRPSSHPLLTSQNVILLIFGSLIVWNLSRSFLDIEKTRQRRIHSPFFFSGMKFSGLGEILRGQKIIGYYTDKNLDVTQDAAQFAQAQYVLAPIILDLNNTNHEFILFDCSQTATALQKIREIHAVPFKANPFGIILARKGSHP